MVAYIQFLSTGVPRRKTLRGTRHAGAAVARRARRIRRAAPRSSAIIAQECHRRRRTGHAQRRERRRQGLHVSAALGTRQLQRRRRHAPADRIGELHSRQHAVRHALRYARRFRWRTLGTSRPTSTARTGPRWRISTAIIPTARASRWMRPSRPYADNFPLEQHKLRTVQADPGCASGRAAAPR